MFTDPNSPFYAAIAIGSTKVTGMVGRVDSEGAVNVLSYMAIHLPTSFAKVACTTSTK